jgi:hypothetical protein
MHPDQPRARAGAAPAILSPERSAAVLGQLTGRRGPAPGLLSERRGSADRRHHPTWSFVYGGLRPRRRAGRRTGDELRILLDWHEPRVLYLALAILLMSCADALFTLNLLAVGGAELNGVMLLLLGQGIRWFLWAKIGLTGLSIVMLVISARRRLLGRVPVLWLLRLFCAGYVVLIGWELYLLGWHATAVGDEAIGDFARWVAG